jgi:hypothetical protein
MTSVSRRCWSTRRSALAALAPSPVIWIATPYTVFFTVDTVSRVCAGLGVRLVAQPIER